MRWSQTQVSARLEVFTNGLDADAPNGGKCHVYDGTAPSAGAAVTTQTLLCTFIFANPSKLSITGVTLGLVIPASVLGVGAGTASWCRFTDGADVWLADGDVGASGSGADVEIAPLNIFVGGAVAIVAATETEQ